MNKYHKQILYFLFINISFVVSELRRPLNNDILNYVHVVFEWDQEPNSSYYHIEVDSMNVFNTPLVSDTTSLTIFIDLENIDWSSSYFWRVRGFNNFDSTYQNWVDTMRFYTKEKIMEEIEVINYIDSLVQPGVTIFSGFQPTLQSVAIDKNNRQVWNEGEFNFRLSHINQYGLMYGWSNWDFPHYTGVKVNTDIEILSPPFNLQLDDHAFIELSNGNYMSFTYQNRLGPIPSDNYATEQFRALGYVADDSTEEFQWRGHILTEWDKELNIIWTWNSFDNYTIKDFDNIGPTWIEAYNNPLQYYDWLHSNSIYFDEAESAIYISIRHLSRISKIMYPSGEIIWNMGLPEPYLHTGDNSICSDLLFSFQHHVQKLDNGNIIFFDNGNLSDTLLGFDQPVSRILELNIIENNECQIVWEYHLPPHLMGHGMGSVQILENNNRLIFTHGSGGQIREPTILELTENKDLIWKLTGSAGDAWYRAFRIPSIHPDAYSIVFDNYIEVVSTQGIEEGIFLDDPNMNLCFTIYNMSGYDQPFFIAMDDDEGWVTPVDDTIFIDKKEKYKYEINLDFTEDRSTNFNLIAFPLYHDYAEKQYTYRVFKNLNLNANENFLGIPKKFKLFNPYPNPFNSMTSFNYLLSENMKIDLELYDLRGKLVKTLVKKHQLKGNYITSWDGTDDKNKKVSSGTYLCKFVFGEKRIIKKIIFLK